MLIIPTLKSAADEGFVTGRIVVRGHINKFRFVSLKLIKSVKLTNELRA